MPTALRIFESVMKEAAQLLEKEGQVALLREFVRLALSRLTTVDADRAATYSGMVDALKE